MLGMPDWARKGELMKTWYGKAAFSRTATAADQRHPDVD